MLARQDACVVVLDRSFMNICSNALKARAADYEHMKQCTTVDRAYNLTSGVTVQDGVWRYVVTYTISAVTYTITKYALRDNDLKCQIGALALGDMDTNNFEEIKTMYDKMVQAFLCEEYILAQELYEEISDMLTDCSPYSYNCNC